MPDLPQDLLDYNHSDPNEQYNKINPDNYVTHSQELKDGVKKNYSANSKLYQNTDINITDPQSIQYAGNHTVYFMVKMGEIWKFPVRTMFERESFQEGKSLLISQLTKSKIELYECRPMPVACTVRDLTQLEKEDPMNKRF